ncbi:MAG: hypothetical protein EXR81_04835 [Gammaproteobacteria bacterium]|nr:hypothetical protein [Gammaproteobacteria bacterium]
MEKNQPNLELTNKAMLDADEVNATESATSLFDLPYSEVIELCRQWVTANSMNDIKKRTRLLRKHPELFDEKVQCEIEQILKMANQAIKQIDFKNKIIHLDPNLFKK